jgi:hypothetical protein
MSEELTKSIALRVLDLTSDKRGRHLVCFVANNEVPVSVSQLRLNVFVATELIETANGHWILREPVPGPRRLQFVVSQNLERKLKPLVQFVLPLFGKITGAHNQTSVQVAANQQLLDEQAGHDSFASAWIVG